MIGITIFMLCLGNVFGQYELPHKAGQIDLIRDINNLSVVKDVETSINDGEDGVINNFSGKRAAPERSSDSEPGFYGTDTKGSSFSRLTNGIDYKSNNIFPQQPLVIDVAIGSEVITMPNKSPIITFEVTNNKNVTLDVVFYCTTGQSLINSLNPTRAKINPQETTKLQLVLGTRGSTYEDEITLTANSGTETISKKVLVDVGTQTQTDTNPPSLDYSFLSDCSKYVFSECKDGSWTVEVKAKDTESGLLQVTTNPRGIYFPKSFTSGTKEEVTGTYSESCCNADLQITAIDRSGNKRQISTNAFRTKWGPGQIAAVVLGVLLLIILIVVVVYIIRRIKKKKEFSLATY